MNTTHKAISTLFLATFLAFTPNLVKAQVIDTPATSAQVDALQATLIQLLTQLIAQLQAQITELLAQQATQATQLGAVSTKVEAIQTQTAPAPVVVPVTPTITVGSIVCRGADMFLPVTVSGDWRATLVKITNDQKYYGGGYVITSSGDVQIGSSDVNYLDGSTFTYNVSAYDNQPFDGRGVETKAKLLAEKSSTFVPSCQ